MSPELIAIIAAAVALGGLILRQGQQLGRRIERLGQCLSAEISGQRESLTTDIATLREGQSRLAERLASLEGMIETAFRLSPTQAAQ